MVDDGDNDNQIIATSIGQSMNNNHMFKMAITTAKASTEQFSKLLVVMIASFTLNANCSIPQNSYPISSSLHI